MATNGGKDVSRLAFELKLFDPGKFYVCALFSAQMLPKLSWPRAASVCFIRLDFTLP
jgi:hypothetical protein